MEGVPNYLLAVHPCAHPQPQATPDVLSESVDLPFLDSPYNWNHTVCGIFYLATLTYCNVFEILLVVICSFVCSFVCYLLFCMLLFVLTAEWYFTGPQFSSILYLMEIWIVSTFRVL